MKFFFAIFLLLAEYSISAQKVSTLKEVLKAAKEIVITDSFLIEYSTIDKTMLDEATGKSFIKMIYPNNTQISYGKYFIAGKIMSHPNFNILLMCAERSKIYLEEERYPKPLTPDKSITQDIFLVILDKENNYKYNFLASTNFQFKKEDKFTLRTSSSWFYSNFKVIQKSEIESNKKKYNSSMEYRLNDFGVFVAYPKYTRN